ncbi:MAG: hypothetical protein COB02_10930 [Candidatus Cloacimonadota bacterium]|nr:MAG: hypothetical protein COB02_10930 [Candidatus Cloacimonadota bacterium]
MNITENELNKEVINAQLLSPIPQHKQDENRDLVYGLKFENKLGVFTIKTNDEYKIGDQLIVKTDRAKELATVKYIDLNREIDRKRELEIYSIIKVVDENDKAIILRNIEKQKSALDIAKRKIEALNLHMKISTVEYLFDSSRILFYFIAPKKVDFRELVRLLASEFKTRIELRQITTRQNVSMKGAVGACGRETCCSSFLTKTPVVSMDMVETQRLSKNPAKLNGVCGKLKCCLSYENNFYEEASKGIPTRGSCVSCKSGKKGKVCGINVFSEEMTIYVDEEATYENISFSDILTEEEIKKRAEQKVKKQTDLKKIDKRENKKQSSDSKSNPQEKTNFQKPVNKQQKNKNSQDNKSTNELKPEQEIETNKSRNKNRRNRKKNTPKTENKNTPNSTKE